MPDYPQDWLSAADRGSISTEVCRRYRAFKAYQAGGGMLNGFAERYAEDRGYSFDDVRKWIDLGGWWKGTRRGVALEIRFSPEGSEVQWKATRKKKSISGISSSVVEALQDIGAELSHRLYVDHAKKKADEQEEAA